MINKKIKYLCEVAYGNMHLVARALHPEDFPSMLRLCQSSLQTSRDSLFEEWNILWNTGGLMGVALEEKSALADPKIVAISASVFVSPEYLTHSKEADRPGLISRVAKFPHFIISAPTHIGQANKFGGLAMMIVYFGWEPNGYRTVSPASLRGLCLNALGDRYAGHNLNYLFGEVAGSDLREMAVRSGCEVVNHYETWATQANKIQDPSRPYLVGISKEAALASENQWMAQMFTYIPPEFCLKKINRDILLLARDGLTDQEIAAALGTSTDAVKKRWSSIYARVDAVLPSLLPNNPSGTRGVEKRRALINHIRDHPEELRPFGPGG